MSRRRGSLIMKLKKTVSAVLAGAMLLGTSAFAKDNIYAYNKFISTVIGPQVGYCDFAASFAGHENEYDLSLIHISEPTRRTPISYAVFCLKKKKNYSSLQTPCLLYK